MSKSKESDYWTREAKAILRVELERRAVTYKHLVRMLEKAGIAETNRSIANKVSRGSFSFVFFLQVMRVLEADCVVLAPTKKAEGPTLPQDLEESGEHKHRAE